MFLIIIAVTEFGDYIENNNKNYSCPSYCDVDHEHINKIKQEINNNEYTESDSGLFVWESSTERENDKSSE